ncbi:MAG: hypothetical protein HFF05_03390 [Oscillospiraceae bacterium]|nr:hypothetical protein [Oscillospiraceae bacterium]
MEIFSHQTPLAQVEELEELKRRYGIYDDQTLLRWMEAVKGSHQTAIAELLKERGTLP